MRPVCLDPLLAERLGEADAHKLDVAHPIARGLARLHVQALAQTVRRGAEQLLVDGVGAVSEAVAADAVSGEAEREALTGLLALFARDLRRRRRLRAAAVGEEAVDDFPTDVRSARRLG